MTSRFEGVGVPGKPEATATKQAVKKCTVCVAQMLSLSIDFYVRVFVRVFTSPKDVKDAATRLAYVYQSSGCDSFYLQQVGRKVRTLPLSSRCTWHKACSIVMEPWRL